MSDTVTIVRLGLRIAVGMEPSANTVVLARQEVGDPELSLFRVPSSFHAVLDTDALLVGILLTCLEKSSEEGNDEGSLFHLK